MKTISFAVPCYNSADYMEKCVESLLPCGDDIEIILVDDGSTQDDTPAICDRLVEEHPGIVRAIHKENGGHGSGVNAGLAAAEGLYYKVVDSDDWLDKQAMDTIMPYLREQKAQFEQTGATATDLVIANYVYEKVYEGTHTTIRYTNVFPTDTEFSWSEVGRFNPSQYLLMHSVIYRTEMLRDMGLKLPEHCFYVDNIFVYVPLPHVKTMRYFDVDMYRYFIGREDQSVNEKIMLSRIDQQIRITKVMIDSVDVMAIENKRLRNYMKNYLSMMMCICSVFLRMEKTDENEAKRADIWAYLRAKDENLYHDVRHSVLNLATNIPSDVGRMVGITGYHIAQKIFKFN
ncbi:MAG: glycosyltransferase [Eggerthellaceae bacterium]|nr:glycosyltransferase [Eggerthellaceae bacterium]